MTHETMLYYFPINYIIEDVSQIIFIEKQFFGDPLQKKDQLIFLTHYSFHSSLVIHRCNYICLFLKRDVEHAVIAGSDVKSMVADNEGLNSAGNL